MGKRLLYLVLGIVLVSCGTKVSKNPESLIKEVELHSAKIDSDKALGTDITEGALTDAEGFKDIGKFKSTVVFNKETSELLKITNVETTDKTITEKYYFKNNKLSYFDSSSGNSNSKKLYLNNGKVVSSQNISPEEQKLFIAKARRFQQEFNETH
ncbi:hypothetical protein [Confluentibacter citreus]|uniref:hypothetical protein n=1 Tax=Confluentibacter citreus TaxID=2007307 RepID=UPI000C286293|nr:hypothetical protein [Confluentibacter citreus]